MFELFFEKRRKVMLVQYREVFSSDDISSLDSFVTEFVVREGHIRSIFDFTRVNVVAVSRSRLIARGRKARMNPGKDRVVVAPQQEIYELYRDYAQQQLSVGNGGMFVVASLPDALQLLELHEPRFEPLIGGDHQA